MAIGLATGLGGAAAALTFGSSLLAAFLAYSLCGAMGVLLCGLVQARAAQSVDAAARRDAASAPTRNLARGVG
ncbi:MAG: hypothetical protein VYD87_18470 [Pseudomonadota bacterium]|nr:hypothetical protein [Pseudomonadota bacterium]MEE3099746.1 hypothetical protein [Pseudomonadota bacterium]